MLWRMSLRGTSGVLEGIYCVAFCGTPHARLQASGVQHVDPAREQLGHGPLDANEIEHGESGRLVDLDQDVQVAAGARIATRD